MVKKVNPAAAVRSRTFAEWLEHLYGMKGQWSPVQDTLDLQYDPQVQENGYLQELRTKDGHPFTLVSTPVQFGEEPQPFLEDDSNSANEDRR